MTESVRQPDLSVYYSLLIITSGVRSTQNEYIVETSTRPLFINREVTQDIGYVTFVSNMNPQTSLDTITIVLPFGSLCAQNTSDSRAMLVPSDKSIKVGDIQISSQQEYNTTFIYTILSGNGDFIGSKGYVTITTDDTLTRRVDFWLDKQ